MSMQKLETKKKNGKKKLSNYDNDVMKHGKEVADKNEIGRAHV